MRLLLDTHLLLWSLGNQKRLPTSARRLLEDPDNDVFVSTASIWEIAIKASLGTLQFDPQDVLDSIEPAGFELLPVSGRHAVEIARLEHHHRDPFDRMLIAQSRVEPLRLLTSDKALVRYGELVMFVK